METTGSLVIPTHIELVKDLLDTLTETESDSVKDVSEPSTSGTKLVTVQSVQSNSNGTATVAENLDSDICGNVATNESDLGSEYVSAVKPLGAKDSLSDEAGVKKKKKRKKKLSATDLIERKFPCDQCGHRATSEENLSVHKYRNHPAKWCGGFY